MEKATIRLERRFSVSVDKVWQAITDNNQMKDWYFTIPDFEPIEGKEFSFTGTTPEGVSYLHHCRIIEVIPQKKLVYTWRYHGFEGNSIVSFELFKEGNATRLQLTHSQLESFPSNQPDLGKDRFEAGWDFLINTSLVKHLQPALVKAD